MVNLKISKLGGLTRIRQLRDLCVELGIAMTLEDSWGGDLATAAIAHLAQSTTPELLFSTGFNSYVTVSTAEGHPPGGWPHGGFNGTGAWDPPEDGRAQGIRWWSSRTDSPNPGIRGAPDGPDGRTFALFLFSGEGDVVPKALPCSFAFKESSPPSGFWFWRWDDVLEAATGLVRVPSTEAGITPQKDWDGEVVSKIRDDLHFQSTLPRTNGFQQTRISFGDHRHSDLHLLPRSFARNFGGPPQLVQPSFLTMILQPNIIAAGRIDCSYRNHRPGRGQAIFQGAVWVFQFLT